jgi:hypothetical protein
MITKDVLLARLEPLEIRTSLVLCVAVFVLLTGAAAASAALTGHVPLPVV